MKTMRRFGALFCAISLVFALVACSNNGGESEADIAEILAAADKKVSEANSMEANMTMDMDMTMLMQGQNYSMQFKTLMGIVMFNDPMKMKINATMSMDLGELSALTEEMDEQLMEMYILKEDDTYTMYTNEGDGWDAQAVDMSTLDQYDPQNSMELYLKSAESFQKVGEETIQDVKATKYTGVISSEALEEVIAASGVADSMNSIGMDVADMDWNEIYSDMGNMPISIWIDEEGYPIRYEMDMMEIMNTMYDKIMEQMGVEETGAETSFTKVLVSMDCFNYNQAPDFELPEEAAQ